MSMGVCSKCHTFGEPIDHNGRGLRCPNCWATWDTSVVLTPAPAPVQSLDGMPAEAPADVPAPSQSKPATGGGKKKRKQ